MKKPLKYKGSNTVTLCQIISPYPFSFKYIMVIVISLYYYNSNFPQCFDVLNLEKSIF